MSNLYKRVFLKYKLLLYHLSLHSGCIELSHIQYIATACVSDEVISAVLLQLSQDHKTLPFFNLGYSINMKSIFVI